MPSTFHIGFDDTDSSEGMCTTFLCYNLVKELISDTRNELLDYPNLIRLNPNIPWKTRGNAALAIRLRSSLSKKNLFALCGKYIKRFATSPRANAGLVLFEGEEIPAKIQDFSNRAMYSVLGLVEAREIVREFCLESISLRSNQGLIGALAAVGNVLPSDHTFELIAYRKSLSKPRVLDKSKIVMMSEVTSSKTFSSYDSEYDRIMIAPHGPDPVFLGIRGESAAAVKNAFNILCPVENLRGWMIFRSNQGTGEHLREPISLDNPKAYYSGKTLGTVCEAPRTQIGGHVFFEIENEQGKIGCACYEPTAVFREFAKMLTVGDVIEVGGGIRKNTTLHPKVLNLEYFKVVKLAEKFTSSNPKCLRCGVSMGSMGRGQGFRCEKCGQKSSASKHLIEQPRGLTEGRIYIPPVRAHRHLTKPESRFQLTKKRSIRVKLINGWES